VVSGEKSLAAIERDVAQRKVLLPWVFITDQDVSERLQNLQFSNLNRPLDDNVQILTLEPWKDDTLLLRLEHVLEKNEDENLSKETTVDLSDLFATFTITELQETTLGGNIPLDENVRLSWPGSSSTEGTKDVDGLKVTLAPMQIRTFLAKITPTL
jgi:lysosomal alpha-mannosidase